MRKQKGFTLIELLVVIAILAIISAVAITSLNPFKIMARGRDGTRKTDLGAIKAAIELYYSQNHAYPAAGASPVCPGTAGNVNFGCLFTDAASNVYLRTTPQDPKSGWGYCYTLSSGNYTLCANVEDAGSVNSTPGCTPTGTGAAGTYCLTNPF